MTFQIRVADEPDAAGILQVKQAVWPDSNYDLDLIKAVIADPEHVTHVAEVEGVIAGFVDGFKTVDGSGISRWELDLIAVDPDFQNRGIATRLMIENTITGRWRDARMARGLVEVSNVGSQRTFARCGYQTDEVVHGLYVLPNHDLSETGTHIQKLVDLPTPEEHGLHFVRTLNYVGIWLEGDWNIRKIRIVKKRLSDYTFQLAGSVVPVQADKAVSNLQSEGFELIGHFHWWKRDLTENEQR